MGELAALSASLLWALASVVYAQLGQQISPLGLNLGKGLIAIALLILTLGIQNQLAPDLSIQSVVLLSGSGAIGIGIGDTVFFEALRHLGARRTLLLQSLAPPMTACLALVFLQETLSPWAWVGMSLTLMGITWVISERTPMLNTIPQSLGPGISFALLAALAQASGAVLSRAALADTQVSPLWSAFLRLCAGVLLVGVVGLFRRPCEPGALRWPHQRLWLRLLLAAFGGTYLGIWLQQIGLKYAAAGIAQTLGATSPLFILPIVVILGETVSVRAWLGAVIAVGGVALLLVAV